MDVKSAPRDQALVAAPKAHAACDHSDASASGRPFCDMWSSYVGGRSPQTADHSQLFRICIAREYAASLDQAVAQCEVENRPLNQKTQI